jgi:hypothetical protein
MHPHLNQTCTIACERPLRAAFENWLVLPGPLTFTCDEYLGNPEQEILVQCAEQAARQKADPFQTPEIDPDEFESAYLWFLA